MLLNRYGSELIGCKRLFLHYGNGKCHRQVFGKNYFKAYWKKIVRFLHLWYANEKVYFITA